MHSYLPLRLGDPRVEAWPELGATTDADGHFRLPGFTMEPNEALNTGSVGVVAVVKRDQRHWFGEAVGPVRPSKEGATDPGWVLEVRPSVDLRGRVVDGLGGQALRDLGGQALGAVRVRLSGTGAVGFGESMTSGDGRFEFAEVPAFARPHLILEREGFGSVEVFQPDARPRTWVGRSPELEVAMGRPVRLQGKVIDGFRGGPTLVPVEVAIRQVFEPFQGWVAQVKAEGWSDGSETREIGAFDVRVPAGPVRIEVTASTKDGAYQRPYQHEFWEVVPAGGAVGWELQVPRRPGVLVQLVSEDAQRVRRHGYGGDLLVSVREAQGLGVSRADSTPLWFFPLPAWGAKAEVQMVRRRLIAPEQTEDREILPWTELVADPATWPLRLAVP